MKLFALALVFLGACALDADTGTATGALGVKDCDDWICGSNSPVIDGLGFHELNLDGAFDSDGFRLGYVEVNEIPTAKLTVVNGVIGFATLGTGQPFYPGPGDDVQIQIFYKTVEYRMRIFKTNPHTPFWATLGGANPGFTSYIIQWNQPSANRDWAYLCQHTDAPDLDQYYATVFEGERIVADTKRIASYNPRWFNIGCAGSTQAKLQLTGHTQAAERQGFSTTLPERQTMIKMLSGDYCGTGKPFTVAGQPLHWTDDHGTMHLPLSQEETLEAEWGPDGAVCLKKPRVLANPTPLDVEVFGNDNGQIDQAMFLTSIADECGRTLPPCTAAPSSQHLASYNPGAFIVVF